MKKINIVFLVGFIMALLSACASHSNNPFIAFKGQTVSQVYQNARASLLDGEFSQAIKSYEALAVLYPFNRYSEKAQLGLIYAYYKDGDSPSAKTAAQRFIYLYPHSQYIDYAYYMRAMADMDQDRGWYLRYVPIDLALRDPGTMRLAYQEFAELIRRYPDSPYVPDARQRMIYLRNLFARYELHIADYYFRRKAYIAAANRANEIIQQYQGAPEVKHALMIMIKAYRILGLETLARQSLAIYRLNYPDSI
ncbi:outer membrane protein assembly factor BamD [Rickettsiella grylli]|uniref:Outer membrane protein assembly factor BamD n=1 Tax=Rickettsiella grylli TaxID=59196 RepID=A8PNZ9_9COXI|nr:outer membrane protein assembly factor BamD [Rickettsiella grylli]EDP46674.1 competence lipoprotein ComL [Rickettsiella grylli]